MTINIPSVPRFDVSPLRNRFSEGEAQYPLGHHFDKVWSTLSAKLLYAVGCRADSFMSPSSSRPVLPMSDLTDDEHRLWREFTLDTALYQEFWALHSPGRMIDRTPDKVPGQIKCRAAGYLYRQRLGAVRDFIRRGLGARSERPIDVILYTRLKNEDLYEPVERAFNYAEQHEPDIASLMYCRKAGLEFLRFFEIMCRSSKPVALRSRAVELLWHEILADTGLWRSLCAEYAPEGRLLHYAPGAIAAFNEDAYATTLTRYVELFDEEPPFDIWPPAFASDKQAKASAQDDISSLDGERVEDMSDAGSLLTSVTRAMPDDSEQHSSRESSDALLDHHNGLGGA